MTWLPGFGWIIHSPWPDEPLVCLMPRSWKADVFLKPDASSSTVMYATLHHVPFASVNGTTSGEVHELPELVIQMPPPDEHLLCLMREAGRPSS